MRVAPQPSTEIFNFGASRVELIPFPHFHTYASLAAPTAEVLLRWLESDAGWEHRDLGNFGSYSEVNLRSVQLPASLNLLRDDNSVIPIIRAMEEIFGMKLGPYVDIMAHKMGPHDALGVHTDDDGMLSHRLVLHLHRSWFPDGGELRLHQKSEGGLTVGKSFPPRHRAAFAFEISQQSFHSIQRVETGDRYTLVYSFFRP